MSLQLSTEPVRSFGYIVKLDGALDSNTSATLETELQRLLALEPAVVVLDLAKLTYLSSTGIRVIQKSKRAMEAAGGELKLLDPQPLVAKVFDFAQITPLNEMFANIEEFDAYLDRLQKPPSAP
jgi:anti-anti-sigma factor